MIAASPSLSGLGDRRTYEVKFEVPLNRVGEVCDWAKQHLALDPYGDESGAYRVTTRYTDTPSLAVFHKEVGYRTRKFRIRRYGSEDLLFLEMKRKRGSRVQKQRVAVQESSWPWVAGEALWFTEALSAKDLRPVGTVTYLRHAFGTATDAGPIRLTLDLDLHGTTEDTGMSPMPCSTGLRLAPGFAPLELKFANALPSLFREFLEAFRFAPCGFSKYRSLMEAAALSEVMGA